jgi:glycosyltransferase involved in cell wall biosynthesis
MKVAFVHDWFTIPAGAEKVAAEIIDLIQPHSVFSLFNFMDFPSLNAITQGRGVKTSFLQQIPMASEHYRHLAPLYPNAISKLDVSQFDVIISSSWMAAKGIQKREGQVHICYCHTPMRFAWGLESTYLEKYGYDKGLKKLLAKLLIRRLRNWDEKSASNVDHFISNSNFVKKRIKDSYDRNAQVIYPPVNTAKFSLYGAKSDYFFTACRFVDYKNLELIIQAFHRLPNQRLVIAGQGPMDKQLRKMAQGNVEFLGWVSDEKLVYYMQRAKAFVNASIEDFGIAGLEAQSCGTPVIALGEGGYTETVIENETGVFFHRAHPEALADAILRFNRTTFDPHIIRKNAIGYDRCVFRERFLNFFLDKTCLNVSELV